MTYSFRIKFVLPPQIRLGIESDKLLITAPNNLPEISFRSIKSGIPISTSSDVIVIGEGYTSESEARLAGEEFMNSLIIAFSRLHIGANFSEREFKSYVSPDTLTKMAIDNGFNRVLLDFQGLMVFETMPDTHFVTVNAEATIKKDVESLLSTLKTALEIKYKHSDDQSLAYKLFSDSFFLSTADAKLLILMTGIETLINPVSRDDNTKNHVEFLIESTKNSDSISTIDRDSIIGSLQWLFNESISQSGRKLSKTLGSRKYLGLSPEKFFTHCYNLRSALTHGNNPRPSQNEVDLAAAHLVIFLGDLLAGPLLEKVDIGENNFFNTFSMHGSMPDFSIETKYGI